VAAVSGEAVEAGLYAVAARVLAAAQEALDRTPEQLPVLARAGVVDAGGAGLVLVLECLERLAAGDDGRVVLGLSSSDRRGRFRPEPEALLVTRPLDADVGSVDEPHGPEYEVMYLLAVEEEERIPALRARLSELGDSVIVVGGDGEWNVHAHVDDPGAAVEAGIDAGRPHRVRITRLVTDEGVAAPGHGRGGADDHGDAGRAARDRGVSGGAEPRTGIVACAAGAGLATVLEEAGAVVLWSGPGRRASTGELIDAIRRQHASGVHGVVVLPNDTDTELAAAAAARAVADEGIEAFVVRARTAVQGVAAIAVFEPEALPSANILAMQSAASATRHGAVTIANRVGLTSGGPCQPGDVLGVVDGDIVIVGSDQLVVAREVVHRLLSSGGELVTVVVGESAPDGLVRAIEAEARGEHRGVEVTVIDGGQPVYTALIGAE
jgi:dihydroxyacetone kinase-like predicted kinase